MKKQYLSITFLALLIGISTIYISCNEETHTETNTETKKIKTEKKITFPKYSSVLEMLEAANDYKDECLEVISKEGKPVHVRISSEHLNNEPKKELTEQVKRDIIHVIFQAFAQTEIEKITVTSIPITRSNFNPNNKYDGKQKKSLKQTVTVNRKKATDILNKYLQTTSFQDLYKLYDGVLYIPNAKFEILMYSEFESVFNDLKK